MSVLNRKSLQDIRQRWARSIFTVLTIAAAVAGLGLFALPTYMDRAMFDRIEHDNLHDVRIFTEDIVLSAEDREALQAIDGVVGVGFRTVFGTELRAGDRRDDALLVGVEDFAVQDVNVVSVESGAEPGPGEALSDTRNSQTGRLDVAPGTVVQLEDTSGDLHDVTVVGTGATLEFSQAANDGEAVLYASQETVNAIAGSVGINSIEFKVEDPENAQAVSDAAQALLTENHPEIVFTDLPDTREPGTWPNQEIFENFSTLFYVGAILALISAVALISNVMTTMVAEQRREIAIMKAIGGRRRQVTFSFLRTIGLLAIAGSLVGVAIGVPFSWALARFIGNEFAGVTPGFGVVWPVVFISLAIGIIGTTLAAVPALIRASRMSVKEGMTTVQLGSTDGLTRLFQRIPAPRSASVGLRNLSRRRGRAIGTIFQIGLAVGVALGFLGLGVTVGSVTADTWDTMKWDVIVAQSSNVPLDDRAMSIVEDVEGVAQVEPVLYNTMQIDGTQYEAWGLPAGMTLYEPSIVDGRWLEPADSESRARVVVIGRALSNIAGLDVGDMVPIGTARGVVDFEVIGIDSNLGNNGTMIFVPIETFQEILNRDDTNALWVVSESQAEADIDAMTGRIEDALTAAGFPVSTQVHYVEKRANLASNRTLTWVLAVMGGPIVAIGLIGLVNMMTMNVIERTREVGILRCIGARSRDISRIFRAEALAVAILGWIISIPLGWAIGWVLVRVVTAVFDFGSVPYTFPWLYPFVALVATVLLASLIVIPPLRRATRLKPGDALRYE